MEKIKLSEVPSARKFYEKNPKRTLNFMVLLSANCSGTLKECILAKNSSYLKTERYEDYIFTNAGKLQILMHLDKYKAFYEMAKADVSMKILSKYAFENLFVAMS
jgi:hypothetical protein